MNFFIIATFVWFLIGCLAVRAVRFPHDFDNK